MTAKMKINMFTDAGMSMKRLKESSMVDMERGRPFLQR